MPSQAATGRGRGMAGPTAVDLFCGAGGLTRGLLSAGFTVLGAVEIEPLAAESYSMNFPAVKLWESDIADVTVGQVRRRFDLCRGELDLLAGCPPCEGFSRLRTLNVRRDRRDPRNDLVLQFVRFIRGLMPKTVLIENVPALATDPRLAEVTEALERLGYWCDCRIVNAAEFGVPQRRRRMLFVASRTGPVPFARASSRRATVREFIATLPPPGRSGDPLHDHGEQRDLRVVSMIREIPKDGGSRMDLPAELQLRCHRRTQGFYDIYGRMAWDRVAPTITSGCVNPSKGRFLHPEQDRTITLREAALLQTFPPDHRFSLRRGKYAAAEMIGNGLPPELVRRQALEVVRRLAEPDRRRPTTGRRRSRSADPVSI